MITGIYHFLNKTFFDSCSKIDKSWRKRKRSIDTKLIVLFLMKIISGKNNHGYSYIISENDINHRGNDSDCIDSRENKQKLNFKNCLFLVVKHLSLLMQGIKKHLKSFYCALSEGLAGMTQRVKPGRHYPRKSMRPRTRWNSFDAPARV
ncbi:hypothetical protein C5472_19385 [Photorhabdus sp. RW14-46]|nr:hypothetical protein [Photorhabdus sp. RW14-46]